MSTLMKSAITQLFLDFSGKGNTTDSNDVFQRFANHGTNVWPLLPSNETTASEEAYRMEMIKQAPKGEFVNWLPIDFNVNGMTGDTGKYFNSETQPSNFPQDDVGYYVRSHAAGLSSRYAFGSTNSLENGVGFVAQTSSRLRAQLNTSYQSSFTPVPSTGGLIGIQRGDGTNKQFYRNGLIIFNTTSFGSSTAPINQDLFFWANNLNGVASNFWIYRMSFLISGAPALSDSENFQIYEAITAFNTTIGR